ncbi:MAG: ribonuclease III domain-containing protein [Synechococcus sp. ELA057]
MASLPAQPPQTDLGALQLAWLGDAVWDLHQRLRHCRLPGRAADLHHAVVAEVKAQAQAGALQRLDPWLTAEEREQVRRGRNRAGAGPRGGDRALYGQATGFETMLGWLFLRNPGRLAELLDHLEETASPSAPHAHESPP